MLQILLMMALVFGAKANEVNIMDGRFSLEAEKKAVLRQLKSNLIKKRNASLTQKVKLPKLSRFVD